MLTNQSRVKIFDIISEPRKNAFKNKVLLAIVSLLLATFASSFNVSAASISAGSTAYTASISTGDTANIPQTGSIIPTADSKVYTSAAADSNVKFSSTCPKGSSISVNTDNTSNALVHTSDNTKTIPATTKAIVSATSATLNPSTGSSLADNTWGLSLDSGNTFAYVPAKGSPVVLYKSTKAEGSSTNPITIPVIYGVKVNNKISSGTYSNSVVYTLAVSGECLTYPLSFDANGGTIANTAYNYNTQNLNYGQTINLANYKPKKDGYVFAGWTATYTKADGSISSSSFSGGESSVNINPSNLFAVKVKANWSNGVANFNYTGTVQTYTAPADGYYKLEVWGASGGGNSPNSRIGSHGGTGGFSYGTVRLTKNTQLYIFAGGAANSFTGGFNGGGNATGTGSGGGGMSHISLISNTSIASSTWNPDGTLIVAGGGGGTDDYSSDVAGAIGDTNDGSGGYGGGLEGGGAYSDGVILAGYAGTQVQGYIQGIGQNSQNPQADSGGGGAGWFGGRGGTNNNCGGGGGSGWIYTESTYNNWKANGSDASNVTWTVSASYYLTNAATIAGNQTFRSPSGTDEVGHTGNGYARITYLGSTL